MSPRGPGAPRPLPGVGQLIGAVRCGRWEPCLECDENHLQLRRARHTIPNPCLLCPSREESFRAQSGELLRQRLQSLVRQTDRSPKQVAVPDAMTRPTRAEHVQSRMRRRLRMRRTTPVACCRNSRRPLQTVFRRFRSATLRHRRRTGAEASSWATYPGHPCPASAGTAHPGADRAHLLNFRLSVENG